MDATDKDHVKHNNEHKLKDIEIEDDFKVAGWGCRHQQCLLLFAAFTVAYSMRACMGVSLVAMTAGRGAPPHIHTHAALAAGNATAAHVAVLGRATNGSELGGSYNDIISNSNKSKEVEEYPDRGFLNVLMLTAPYPTFKWNKKIQDVVLSAFGWGYMAMQIPAGQVAHRFGARYLLTGALLTNCVVSLSLPHAALHGGWALMAAGRVLQGLSQSCVMPGIHTFLGKWAPLEERGRLASLVYGGQALGTVLGLPLTGFVAASGLGWPGVFRVFGVLSGLAAAALWARLADCPARHPRISPAERRHIELGLAQCPGPSPSASASTAAHSQLPVPVPWGRILRSRGMLAIVVAHVGQTWSHVTMYNEVPAFMDKVMGVAIKANGLLSALPFLVMWVMNFFFSWCTDMLIVKKVFSVTRTRKLAQTIGCLPPALGLVALAYVPKDIYVVETLLVLIMALNIASHFGFQVNHIDIAPNFAGTMMSVSNFVSNLCGALAPLVAGFILTDVTSEHLWRQVFFVTAAFLVVTNAAYVALGTARRAAWNEPPEDNRNAPGQEKRHEAEHMFKKTVEC